MAQINLDTSALSRINDGTLSDQKERKAILDYLYQLTEQLRYWQNNVELDNLTEEARQVITGIVNGNAVLQVQQDKILAKVEDQDGNIAQIVILADQIQQIVQDMEGNVTTITQTAESAMIKAENAEGRMALLEISVDEIRAMVGTQSGQKSYVQWEEPADPLYGDIWIKSSTERWITVRAKTWAEVMQKTWEQYYTPYPLTMVWDGHAWQTISDQRIILEQYTLVTQTAEEIRQTAVRVDVVEGQIERHDTLILQNADAIKLKAAQSDLDGTVRKLGEIEVEVDAVTQRVQDAEGNIGTLTTKANSIESRVEDAEDNIGALTVTAEGIEARVEDAEGHISTLTVTAEGIESRVEDAEGNIATLETRADGVESRVEDAEGNISELKQKANSIEQTVKGKVDKTTFDQSNNAFNLRVESVEEQAGKAETVTNTAMTLDKTGFHLKTGGTFTVDSGNFDVDENGNMFAKSATLNEAVIDDATITNGTIDNAEITNGTIDNAEITNGTIKKAEIESVVIKDASVSGNLTNNGIAVLTAKNLVVSSTQPTSPVPGMVWVKPVGSVAATFLYNNTTVQSFKNFETAHTLTNAGSAVAASGTYTFNVKIPYKVTSNVSATRYLTMYVNGMAIFTDVALEKTAGTYTLELGGNLYTWMGNANSLSFTLNLHYMSGDDGTLYNVHRVDVGAIDLKLYAKSNAASGWSGTEVQVYNG